MMETRYTNKPLSRARVVTFPSGPRAAVHVDSGAIIKGYLFDETARWHVPGDTDVVFDGYLCKSRIMNPFGDVIFDEHDVRTINVEAGGKHNPLEIRDGSYREVTYLSSDTVLNSDWDFEL